MRDRGFFLGQKLDTPDVDEGFQRYPDMFEIPRQLIGISEIIAQFNARRDDIVVSIGTSQEPAKIVAGYETSPINTSGDAFVYWRSSMDRLNGTYVDPEDFFRYMAPIQMTGSKARDLVLGDGAPRNHPWVAMESPERLVRVNVFAGARSQQARVLSEIGDSGTFGPSERMIYQNALFELYTVLVSRKRQVTKAVLGLDSRAKIYHDIEDCAATADTLAGVGLVKEHIRKRQGLKVTGRRIDVAVATGHAVALLASEAIRQGLPTEINIGFLAWGLSRGIGPNLDHKNYITHAPLSELRTAYGNQIFVVGDMGLAAQRKPGLPWDRYRKDQWGLHGQGAYEYSAAEHLDLPGSLRVGYTNGGLLMMALADSALADMGRLEPSPTLMAIAKRLDSRTHGFALRLDGFIQPLLAYHRGVQ